MAPGAISILTRRHLRACFVDSAWHGDQDEVSFLGRLYDLRAMPSTDQRFKSADSDIYCHRISFNDWDDDWIFDDSRFELERDDTLLRFLAETLHPEVRQSVAVSKLADALNQHLRRDGWELAVTGNLSGYPVYGGRRYVAVADFPPALGSIIAGRYELIDLLGAGGYGCVMRARDGHRDVAIKFFDAEDESVKRFEREVSAMRAISHPNVISVIDADLVHSPPYFVMPLAECTLDAWATRFRDDKRALVTRFLQVCDGVHTAHTVGLLHRDLKPLNMLVFGDNTVVADFGLVRDVARDLSKLTRTTTILGTEEYLAPEQRVRGGSRMTDERTDVYMLGRSLYELLTGQSPSLIDEDATDPGIASVITKATAEHPNRRYATVMELSNAVRAYLQSLDSSNAEEQCRTAFGHAYQNNTFYRDRVASGLQHWLSIKNERVALDLWDELALEALVPMATLDPGLLELCLRRLKRVFDDALGARPWVYAETVAKRMYAIVATNPRPAIAAEALRLALVAAVEMDRFAAMDVFNEMLANVKSAATAAAVAEMLREERVAYRRVAKQVEPEKLQIAIRIARESTLAS